MDVVCLNITEVVLYTEKSTNYTRVKTYMTRTPDMPPDTNCPTITPRFMEETHTLAARSTTSNQEK